MIAGKTKQEAHAITKDEVLEEIGAPLSPARVKCALLGYKVMQAALYGLPARQAGESI